MAEKKKGVATVLNEYFERRPKTADADLSVEDFRKLSYERQVAVGGLKGFAVELKRLSDEEKLELARLAAVELGYAQEDVEFSFS